jgi:hypothetical protein
MAESIAGTSNGPASIASVWRDESTRIDSDWGCAVERAATSAHEVRKRMAADVRIEMILQPLFNSIHIEFA